MSAQPQPANRNLGGRPPGINRRRQELIAAYVKMLGGVDTVTPVQMVDIERAAGLTLLAQEMRAKALRGEPIAISDLTRLEGASDRAVRRLRLPAQGEGSKPPSIAEYAARKAAEKAASKPAGDPA